MFAPAQIRTAAEQAVSVLATQWRDEGTRQLLTSLVYNQLDSKAARRAVEVLVEHWRDEATRQLLISLPQSQRGGFAVERERRTAGTRPSDGGDESPRTTKLYDRTKDEITLSDVERIRL
jgi:hypothetical protein